MFMRMIILALMYKMVLCKVQNQISGSKHGVLNENKIHQKLDIFYHVADIHLKSISTHFE